MYCAAHIVKHYMVCPCVADGPNTRIQKIVDSGICQKLCHFLMLSTEREIMSPALRAVGNILTGDDLQTQVGTCIHMYVCMYGSGTTIEIY